MKHYLLGFLTASLVYAAVAYAQQSIWSTDNLGNSTIYYETAPNTYFWGDSQGRNGIIQPMFKAPAFGGLPAPLVPQPMLRPPC